ncbi:MAG: thiamine pyrophosphate-binding protein [Gemmataceae bacterium]|nr:thiamine pyrophosphate-binding protein [Gemmataceae bacterium]
MLPPISRRTLLKSAAIAALTPLPVHLAQAAAPEPIAAPQGWVLGKMTGAQALVEALIQEGTDVVFGIPGAQENELWDTMKAKGLPYMLVTHEFAASTAADGYARATGKPGVISVVPGPGLTNSLTGIGEALLDSIPMVCIVGDVARGDKYKFFQVHDLPQVGLLQQVTKHVYEVTTVEEIPTAVRMAFQLAMTGEPGPVGVVVPYNLLIDSCHFNAAPVGPPPLAFDENAVQCAIALLSDRKLRWGIYAGLGCMDHSAELAQVAELLQAPVATSISGKGTISDCHPLAVGYGYGPYGTSTAEHVFKHLDGVLAIGVRYSEVSTAFYAIPKHKHLIQVDANPHNLGKVVKPDVCVNADSGLFLNRLLASADLVGRAPDEKLVSHIADLKCRELKHNQAHNYGKCGVDPMQFVLALRRATCKDALLFCDVTMTEHWVNEAFSVYGPRTYFNPADNQAMGWSIPASLGAQRVMPGRQVVTITGDGCFLMSAMEMSTAAREGLPVKFFILDDQAYHYMQALQKPAYLQTTATILARLDYAALARGFGVGYQEIGPGCDIEANIRGALCLPGPVLVRVITDYGKRPCRWIEAAKARFTKELSRHQKMRFLARIGSRALHHPQND